MYILETILLCILCHHLVDVQSFNLTLLHNNDFHSHFAQVNAWSSPCDNTTAKNGKCFGGVARIVAKVW